MHTCRCCEVRSRHTAGYTHHTFDQHMSITLKQNESIRYGCSTQRLQKRQLLAVVAFMEEVLFQVAIRWEINRGERDVS